MDAPDASLPMGLVDCPDGLARCIDGHLEKSRLATVGPGAACPWLALGDCSGECVEGVLVAEEHAKQLCFLPTDAGISRPMKAAAGADECHDARYECVGSRVIDCSDAKQVVAVCTYGCAVETLDDELAEGDAVTIFCRHSSLPGY